MNPPAHIRGIEISIIEKIIAMIQDKYPSFQLGTYYLARLGIDNDIGYRNIRDMVTHFYTAINKDLSIKKREDQIVLAEEHLRRALVEPFEIGALLEFKNAKVLYENLLELLKTAKKKDKYFENVPTEDYLKRMFRNIHLHIVKGREKKSANLWNPEWEEAVKEFSEATELSQELCDRLKTTVELLSTLNMKQQNKRYFIWAILATISCGILGIAVTIVCLLINK